LGNGGIPRGRITQMIGIPTSGMTTLAHKIIANAQGGQGAAVYIDLSGTFDPDYAIRCGVMLDRLLLVRPKTITQTLDIARDLFNEGKLTLVLLDLLNERDTTRPRDVGTMLRKLHEPLAKSRTAALFLLNAPQRPQWQALEEYTDIRLLIQRQTWLYQERDIRGYRVQVTILKDKSSPGEKHIILDLTFDDAVKGNGA